MKVMPKSKFRKLFTRYFKDKKLVDELTLGDFVEYVFDRNADDYFLNDKREWEKREPDR